ncbi:MAG: methylmalonyl-CoA mutase family protein [Crocinitomicaceae bacterium]|nr:methylmalonyl-CoA mutase family protein [Crocinitomicaceae bacterium]
MEIDLTKFEIPNIDSWRNQVLKEVNDEKALVYKNKIENIDIDISIKNDNQPSQASLNSKTDWDILSSFVIFDSFECNKSIIKCLQHGANHIYLDLNNVVPAWETLFKDILLDIIHVTISFQNTEQIDSFKAFLTKEVEEHFSICIDPFDSSLVDNFIDTSVSFSIDGFSIEQIGASSNQQLSLLLLCGDLILQKCKNPSRIKFQMGIGSEFIIEVSKIRAFKWLWQHLLSKNNYIQKDLYILGTTGWANKSIVDPHMNLLRQTTEGLSAVCGGVSGLLIRTASELSLKGIKWFDQRMSLNISHILKEESFLSKVSDPLNGAYVIEMLTNRIIHNSWDTFLELHEKTTDEIKTTYTTRVKMIRELRINNFLNGEKQLLGINLFKNNDNPTEEEWKLTPSYMNLSYLIYENLQENE